MKNQEPFYALLNPTSFKLDGGAMFGIIPKPLWEKKIPADELNRIEMNLRVWIIKRYEKIIIIDMGIGDYHGENFDRRFGLNSKKSPLAALLKKIGIEPEDVTDLIPSHLHFDHIGGMIRLGKNNNPQAIFPSATLHLHKKHYEYSKNPTPKDKGSFQSHFYEPVIDLYRKKNQINWLDGEAGKIFEFLNFKTSHGHTPYQVHPYDENYIFMADLVPTAAHLPLPWVMGYDMQPGKASLEKLEFYEFIASKKLKMIFDHDIQNWGASIKKDTEKGWIIDTVFEDQSTISYPPSDF